MTTLREIRIAEAEAVKVGEVVIVTNHEHGWHGRPVYVTDIEYHYVGGIKSIVVELPEQQSLRYDHRLICRLRPGRFERISAARQRQITNQNPQGFEIIRTQAEGN